MDARQSSMHRVADFVEDTCGKLGLDDDALFAVQLATDEACQNAAEHACHYSPEQQISVTCRATGADLEITIRDRGAVFDPQSIPPPNLDGPLEDRNGGGLGLHFMRQMMDDVRFERTADGVNTLTMVKKGIVRVDDAEDVPLPSSEE